MNANSYRADHLIERLRFLSNGFEEGSETERVMWQAAEMLESLSNGPNCKELVERHRRHVELSPGVGKEVQDYALAVCDDILSDLHTATKGQG